jgi:hypothetical protein
LRSAKRSFLHGSEPTPQECIASPSSQEECTVITESAEEESDPFGGLDAARRFGATTTARLIERPNAGHLPWLDEPSVIGRAIADFLGNTASRDVGGDVPWHRAIAPDSVDREPTALARG